MVQVCRSGLADALQRTDWRIVGWRGSGTWKPSRFVEVVTINRHIKILAWMHVAMGGGLFLVALALLASVYFEGPEYIHTLPFLFGLFTWLAAGLFIPSLAGGIGLLRKKALGSDTDHLRIAGISGRFSDWHRSGRIRTLGAAEARNRIDIGKPANATEERPAARHVKRRGHICVGDRRRFSALARCDPHRDDGGIRSCYWRGAGRGSFCDRPFIGYSDWWKNSHCEAYKSRTIQASRVCRLP